jgi:hypothetical protein
MFVPVTTKPYLNSVNFKVLQWASLHFFLLIKKKTNQHIISCENGINGIFRLTLQTYSDPMVPFRVFTSFVFSESHLKEDFYYGKSSGI